MGRSRKRYIAHGNSTFAASGKIDLFSDMKSLRLVRVYEGYSSFCIFWQGAFSSSSSMTWTTSKLTCLSYANRDDAVETWKFFFSFYFPQSFGHHLLVHKPALPGLSEFCHNKKLKRQSLICDKVENYDNDLWRKMNTWRDRGTTTLVSEVDSFKWQFSFSHF